MRRIVIIFTFVCFLLLIANILYADNIRPAGQVGIYYANSPSLRVTITDRDRDAVSLTGFTVKFRVFDSESDYDTKTYTDDGNDSDLNLSMTNATQSGSTTGQATLDLTKANMSINPGTYYLYLDIVNSGETFTDTANKYVLVVMPHKEKYDTIEVYYANSPSYRISVRDEDFDLVSLTGYTVKFRLFADDVDYVEKTYATDGGSNDLNLSFTNSATTGKATITLTRENLELSAGNYWLYLDKINTGETYTKTLNKYRFKVLE